MPLISEWTSGDDLDAEQEESEESSFMPLYDARNEGYAEGYNEGFDEGKEQTASALASSLTHAVVTWFIVGMVLGFIMGGGCLACYMEDQALTMGPGKPPEMIVQEEAHDAIHEAIEEALMQTPHRRPRED